MEDLQVRLKMAVQQAVCDLVTEYGLLSSTIFEAGSTQPRPSTDSSPLVSPTKAASAHVMGQTDAAVTSLSNPLFTHPSTSERDFSFMGARDENALFCGAYQTTKRASFRPISVYQPLSDLHSQDKLEPDYVERTLMGKKTSTPPIQSASSLPPVVAPSSAEATSGAIFRPNPIQPVSTLSGAQAVPLAAPPTTAVRSPVAMHGDLTLRTDFLLAADEWLGHVSDLAKGHADMGSNSVRKCTFDLDCDGMANKVAFMKAYLEDTYLGYSGNFCNLRPATNNAEKRARLSL